MRAGHRQGDGAGGQRFVLQRLSQGRHGAADIRDGGARGGIVAQEGFEFGALGAGPVSYTHLTLPTSDLV